jgi:hypothetical protein
MLSVARKLARIFDGIALLHMGGAPAVLEVVDALVAHERILDSAKVDPDVRELVREQRSRIEVVIAVAVFPSIIRQPGVIAVPRQAVRGGGSPRT